MAWKRSKCNAYSGPLAGMLMLLLLLQPVILFSQTDSLRQEYHQQKLEPKSFSDDDLTRARKGISYAQEIEEQEEGKKDPNEVSWNEPRRLKTPQLFSGSVGIQTILVVLVIVVLAAVVFIILTRLGLFSNKKVKTITYETLEEIEENLHESDLERFLREALEQGNYKAAVRIYYLMIIKKFSEEGIIAWRKEKTNHQYVSETYDTPLYEPFRQATVAFEEVWYGDHKVDRTHFEKLQPSFQRLIDKTEDAAA